MTKTLTAIKVAAFLLCAASLAFSQGFTPNYGFATPAQGTANWNVPINGNFTQLDNLLHQQSINQVASDPSPCTGQVWFNTTLASYRYCPGGVAEPLTSGSVTPIYVVQVNGTLLTAGDTINFNASTPAAPSNGYAVTFATSKSGTTDSVSAAIVGDGNSAHCLIGTGVFSSCPGSSGGVSGSGTTNTVPLWSGSTALGNSLLTQSGSALLAGTNSSPVLVSNTNSGGFIINTADPSSGHSACTGSPALPLGYSGVGCFGEALLFQQTASSYTGALGVIAGLGVISSHNPGGASLLMGAMIEAANTSTATEVRGLEVDAVPSSSGNVGTNRSGVFVAGNIGTGTLQQAVYGLTTNNGSLVNNYTFYADTPQNTGGSMTHNSAYYCNDQTATATSGTNSDPHCFYAAGLAPNVFQGHLDQVAHGNWADICQFASSTTCSITYATSGASFTSTPVVILTPVNPGSVTFTLTTSSNTGFTITASTSTSVAVNWAAFGNPN